MANTYETTPKNFVPKTDASYSPTHYLDLAGLTSFWGKVKDYVDLQDSKLWTAAKDHVATTDSAMREYFESLVVNGVDVVFKDKDGKVVGSEGAGKGTSATVTIDGTNITVGGTAAAEGATGYETNYAKSTVAAAFKDVDDRLDAIQTELAEGVVSGLIVDVNHVAADDAAKLAGVANSAWVSMNEVGTTNPDGYATGDIKITVDDSAINSKFSEIDTEIADLHANAGVTNIAVKDVDSSTATNASLVEISIAGTKPNTVPSTKPSDWSGSDEDWAAYKANFEAKSRGDILITLDESALDEKLDAIDSTTAGLRTDLSTEIAARKLADKKLADGNDLSDEKAWDAEANGWIAGKNPTYDNIVALSERLDTIDKNLVTQISADDISEDDTQYIKIEAKATKATGSNDASYVIEYDDSVLEDYITTNDANVSTIASATVNGEALYSKATDANGHHTVTALNVVLDSNDIKRYSGDDALAADSVEATLRDHDARLGALVAATEFAGVVGFDPTTAVIGGPTTVNGITSYTVTYDGDTYTFQNGDIVIYGNKEYILDVNHIAEGAGSASPKFVELGDVTAEVARITALEKWVDNNFITPAQIDALFTDEGLNSTDLTGGPAFIA